MDDLDVVAFKPSEGVREEVVLGSEFTTPKHFDPKVKAKAYELYLSSDLAPTEIALTLAIPTETLLTWAKQGAWMKRRQDIETSLMLSAESAYRKFIVQNRMEVLERHLRVSKKLEELAEKLADDLNEGRPVDKNVSMTLKRLAESLSSVTGISARAAAINDRPEVLPRQEGGSSKRPLVVLNMQPSVSPDAKLVEIREVPGDSEQTPALLAPGTEDAV